METCLLCNKPFEEGTGISLTDNIVVDVFCSQECKDNSTIIMKDFNSITSDKIVCPYCKHEHIDSFEFTEDDYEFVCQECDRVFSMTRDVSISFLTTPYIDEIVKMNKEGK